MFVDSKWEGTDMTNNLSVEQRLMLLETAVARISSQSDQVSRHKGLDNLIGSFKDVPGFDEMMAQVRRMREEDLARLDAKLEAEA